jgi:hypothetical protein
MTSCTCKYCGIGDKLMCSEFIVSCISIIDHSIHNLSKYFLSKEENAIAYKNLLDNNFCDHCNHRFQCLTGAR